MLPFGAVTVVLTELRFPGRNPIPDAEVFMVSSPPVVLPCDLMAAGYMGPVSPVRTF